MRGKGRRIVILVLSVALALGALGAFAFRYSLAAPKVTPQPITVTSHTTSPGFDICSAPGMNVMRAWWKSSPYRWMNIYIGGINRACKQPPSPNWIAEAYHIGWGLLPTYVGLQVPSACLAPGLNVATIDLNSTVAFVQGQNSADDAANALHAEYLYPGTIVYFDMEYYEDHNGGRCDAAVDSYLNGWVQELHAKGYKAGVYISARNVKALMHANVTQPDDIWLVSKGFRSPTAGYSSSCSVYGNANLSDSAWHGHRIFQYLVNGGMSLDHSETWGGVRLPDIDSDCADGEIVGHATIKLAPIYTYIGANTDGRLVIVARGQDGNIRQKTQQAPNGLWNTWQELPNSVQFTNDPAIGQENDGRLVIFAIDKNGSMWADPQTAPGKDWAGWQQIPGNTPLVGTPAVARNLNGTIEVFARGTDKQMWHVIQSSVNGSFAGWVPLPVKSGSKLGFASDPSVTQDTDGRLELIARGTDDDIWLNFQQEPNDSWYGWLSVQHQVQSDNPTTASKSGVSGLSASHTFAGSPLIVRDGIGLLHIFARGHDNKIWTTAQTTAGGSWSAWQMANSTFASTTDPAVGIDHSGHLVIAALGTDHNLWLTTQQAKGPTWPKWTAPQANERFTGTPTVAREADGRLELFALDTKGDMWHIFQQAPGGAWGTWSPLEVNSQLQQ